MKHRLNRFGAFISSLLFRKARLLRLTTALAFVTGVLLTIWNLVRLLLAFGSHSHALYVEYADNLKPDVRQLAMTAYRKGCVGFPDLGHFSCLGAIPKPRGVLNRNYRTRDVKQVPPARFISDSTDCDSFRREYGYLRYPQVSQEELDFPLAFIILFHKDFYQVHFLLRAIYRPHNVYCLTPDAQQGPEFLAAARAVASCLPNVFVASRLENITYAGFSRLRADLHCMADLLAHPTAWKYVINMPGQQFPLRTNLEMVKLLRLYNGANDVEGLTGSARLARHYKRKHKLQRNSHGEPEMVPTNIRHPPPPLNLKVVKGSAYNTLSRPFVRFVLTDKRVPLLLEWLKEVFSPDEYFWAMLNHNHELAAPGFYPGKPDIKGTFTMFTIWQHKYPCQTILVREICILTPADFPVLLSPKRNELFANKFYISHFPSALHCLDQMIYNMTVLQRTRPLPEQYDIFFAPRPRSRAKTKNAMSEHGI